jgi:hypothetical protein
VHLKCIVILPAIGTQRESEARAEGRDLPREHCVLYTEPIPAHASAPPKGGALGGPNRRPKKNGLHRCKLLSRRRILAPSRRF